MYVKYQTLPIGDAVIHIKHIIRLIIIQNIIKRAELVNKNAKYRVKIFKEYNTAYYNTLEMTGVLALYCKDWLLTLRNTVATFLMLELLIYFLS